MLDQDTCTFKFNNNSNKRNSFHNVDDGDDDDDFKIWLIKKNDDFRNRIQKSFTGYFTVHGYGFCYNM